MYELAVVAILLGVIIPPLFVVQYTWLADWWRNPTGRTIVALDVCLFVVRASRLGELDRDGVSPQVYHLNWIIVAASLAVPLIIAWRMVEFERTRRRQRRLALARVVAG